MQEKIQKIQVGFSKAVIEAARAIQRGGRGKAGELWVNQRPVAGWGRHTATGVY